MWRRIMQRVGGLQARANAQAQFVRHARVSQCDACLFPPDPKPCFDVRNVILERANLCHGRMIKCFLNTHYWPREPTIYGLWMSLDSPYLDVLTEKYAYSGDRYVAFEYIPRTGEKKLIGLASGYKVYPWVADELEQWAHSTDSRPEKNRMYFCANCIRSPNLFAKHKVDYIYDIEALGTAAEATGQGVALMLLNTAINEAFELKHHVVQVVAVSSYAAKVCERAGMKSEWTMAYSDYVDDRGQKVFYPRRPHHSVTVYSKKLDMKAVLRGEYKPMLKP